MIGILAGCGGGGDDGPSQTLTTITISPTSATVVASATQTFVVKGYDQNSAEMSFTPAFTVTPSELGTVTISGQNAIFTAVKKGTGTLKVTGGDNITATSSITVTTGPLDSLVISPTEVTLYKEDTQQFTVYGTDAEGNAKQRKYITVLPSWFVIGDIGTIDGNGLFIATNQGTGQVEAEATKDDGTPISITADVTVANRAPVISSLVADPTSINTGGTSTITCTASDPDEDTLTYTWTKTGGTITGSGSSVTYTAPDTEGTYIVSVTVFDGGSISVIRSIYITVTTIGPILSVVGNIYRKEDCFGDMVLLGEIKNTGDMDASFVKINFTIRDSSGNVLDSDFTYIYGSSERLESGVITDTILKPSEVGSFKLWANVPNSQVSSYDYIINYDTYPTTALKNNLSIVGNINEIDCDGNRKYAGEICNNGLLVSYFTSIVFTMKNSDGDVIDIDYTYVNGSNYTTSGGTTTDTAIYPNETASFSLCTLTPSSQIASYYYKINWYEPSSSLRLRTKAFNNLGCKMNRTVNPKEKCIMRNKFTEEMRKSMERHFNSF